MLALSHLPAAPHTVTRGRQPSMDPRWTVIHPSNVPLCHLSWPVAADPFQHQAVSSYRPCDDQALTAVLHAAALSQTLQRWWLPARSCSYSPRH